MEKTDKKNTTNWKNKNKIDNERIKKRIDDRIEISDSSPTQKDFQPKNPPIKQKKTTHMRIRKNINEAYDEEDEEDESYVPFFNISLLNESDREYNNNDEQKHLEKNELETIRIAKEQQMAGKLNVIMDTMLMAEKAGLHPHFDKEDQKILNSAEYNIPKARRKLVTEKIEKPLKIDGEIPENKLEKTVKSIKSITDNMSSEAVEGLSAEEIIELDEEDKKEELAKLILQKSGRKKKPKSLIQLAKEINEIEKQQKELIGEGNGEKEKN